jgi:carbon storage regulator
MLILGRKQGEKLYIADNIRITVLGIRGNVVKLGIEAPRGVHVLRAELQRSIPAIPTVAQFRASTLDASADASVRTA